MISLFRGAAVDPDGLRDLASRRSGDPVLAPPWNCRINDGSPRFPVIAMLGAMTGGFFADLQKSILFSKRPCRKT